MKAFLPNGTNNCFVGLFYIAIENSSVAPIYVRINITDENNGPSLYNQSFNPINIIHRNTMVCIAKCKDT